MDGDDLQQVLPNLSSDEVRALLDDRDSSLNSSNEEFPVNFHEDIGIPIDFIAYRRHLLEREQVRTPALPPALEPFENTIHFVKDFYRTVHVADQIAALPKEGSSAKKGESDANETLGKRPVRCIKFHELQLNHVEQHFKENMDDLRPLRNYLLGKQRGSQKQNNVFSVYTEMWMRQFNLMAYSLKFNQDFLQKLLKTIKFPKITAELKITGLDQEEGRRDRERIGGRGCPSRTSDRRIHTYRSESGGMDVLDILKNENKMRLIITSGITARRYSLSKQNLSKIRNKNLIFSWRISVTSSEKLCFPQQEMFSTDPSSILQVMHGLEESSKDVVLVAANGGEIKCHRSVLMAQSATFRSMLCVDKGMLESQTGRIDLNENSEEGLRQFIQCLYGFPVPQDLTSDLALELFQLSNKYGIAKMENYLKELLLYKGVNFFTVDSILELYFFVRNVHCLEELITHALIEMSTLSKEALTGSDYFQKLSRDEAISVIYKIFEWKLQ